MPERYFPEKPTTTYMQYNTSAGVAPHLQRARFSSDPDAILSHSDLDALTLVAFVHENYLDFVNRSIEAAADISQSLADAAYLASHRDTTPYYQ